MLKPDVKPAHKPPTGPKAFPFWTVNGVSGKALLCQDDVGSVEYHPTKPIVRVTTKLGFLLSLAVDRKEFAIWWGSA